LLITGSLLNIE